MVHALFVFAGVMTFRVLHWATTAAKKVEDAPRAGRKAALGILNPLLPSSY